jgi:nucleoside permease NupC
MTIGFVVLISVLFGVVAAAGAKKRQRDPLRWFFFGFLFGPFAWIVFVLPAPEDRPG